MSAVLEPAVVDGDATLVRLMVRNLVAAIVARHGWRLHLRPGADGGLVAEVRMPGRATTG